MKTYRLCISKSDLTYIKENSLPGDKEIVYGRPVTTMLSDARALRYPIGYNIYRDEIIDGIVRLCCCVQEACTRAVECEVEFPVRLEYSGSTCVLNQGMVEKLTDRAIGPKLDLCPTIIQTFTKRFEQK